MDRPLEFCGPFTRKLLGLMGATTLVISGAALAFMPLLLPHRDAITFVQEKRQALEQPKPEPSAGDVAAGKHAGGGKPAGGASNTSSSKSASKAESKSPGH
jgi:hypothetical protein